MRKVLKSRLFSRVVAVLALFCTLAVQQPVSHAHTLDNSPLQSGHHSQDFADSNSDQPTSKDGQSCCHVAISGCSGSSFTGPVEAGFVPGIQNESCGLRPDADELNGRATEPGLRPPKSSS